MQNGIQFDNIYIGHSIDDAIALKNQTWDLKIKAERAQAEADKPKIPDTPKSPLDISFKDDPVLYIREKANLFWTMAQRDPVEAIKTVPEIAGGAGLILVTLLAVLGSVFLGGSSAAAAKDKAKDAAKKVADKTAEAVTTGADKAQAEVTKRTTRSSQQ
jgi:calnexin